MPTVTAISQFDDKLKNPGKAGDARYIIPYPTVATDPTYNWRTFNFFSWLRGLSSEANGENFTAATFDGENVYLLANKAHFDAEVATATGAELTSTTIAKTLTYSATTFRESAANNGSITDIAYITLDQETFAGENNAVLAGAVVTNVPAGLTAVVTKVNSRTASLHFTGAATAHAATNSITNLTVTLGNTAFTGGSASAVTGATNSTLHITFVD